MLDMLAAGWLWLLVIWQAMLAMLLVWLANLAGYKYWLVM
jgi:hypothetical protein